MRAVGWMNCHSFLTCFPGYVACRTETGAAGDYCRIPERNAGVCFPYSCKSRRTGFAQIYGKYNTVPYDKLKLDLFYIENYSLWMDLKLILMTVKTVLKKDSTEGVDTDQTTGLKEHTEGNEEVERKIQEYTSREESHHE